MAMERYGSKTDVVVKLVLVFFIALLSFSIGTFVGKKFSDNQHKLAQLEPGHDADSKSEDGHGEDRGIASVSPEAGNVKPEKALSDDEIAKLAEEFVTDDEKPTAEPGKMNDRNVSGHETAQNTHSPSPATGEHAPASVTAAHPAAPAAAQPGVLKPAARMAQGQPAVVENPPKITSRIPNALPEEVASSAIGKFTVQVASYSTEKEAQSMAADLKAKGFSAFYVSAKVKGQTWYRVSVGLFTTSKEADAYKKDLISRAKVSSAIVQKITSAD
ncbi:MAG: SPOR domain-containing protein [Pseudobdellovibrionaceae bacterium]